MADMVVSLACGVMTLVGSLAVWELRRDARRFRMLGVAALFFCGAAVIEAVSLPPSLPYADAVYFLRSGASTFGYSVGWILVVLAAMTAHTDERAIPRGSA